MRIPSIALALAAAAPAQAALTARSFLPDDHRNVAFVDLAALREQGIWDELEVSALKLVFAQMEKESGLALRAIDRITMVAGADPEPDASGRRAGNAPQVCVIEGNAPLGMPPAVRANGEHVEIGPYQARSRWGELCVNPRPELYVAGSESIVRPVLEGRPHRGTAAADVMSLVSGRAQPVAWFVVDVTQSVPREHLLAAAFPETTWPADQAPTFVCVRLLVTGDADDPHVAVEAIVRHAKDGDGVAATRAGVEALRERLAAMPQLRSVKQVLAAMTAKADRGDVVCTLELGRARNAVGHVAALGSLLFLRAMPEAPVPAGEPLPPVPDKKQ